MPPIRSRHSQRGSRNAYRDLALRLQEMVAEQHANSLSGTEKFTVRRLHPLTIEHLGSDLRLQEGDPDFTIGAWTRQFLLNYNLAAGDVVWCLREGQEWHLVDIADPGGQSRLAVS